MLEQALAQLGILTSSEQLQKLGGYKQLIKKWNRVYNLSALKNDKDIDILHIVDSASSLKFLQGKNILDVGAGAGLPGIVLAILDKNLNISLLDSNNKKVRFLRQCKLELGLDNINSLHVRIEQFKPEYKFDSIISRAFASFDYFVDNCASLLKTGAILVAMKGKWDEQTKYTVTTHKIKVPYLDADRHIVIYKP